MNVSNYIQSHLQTSASTKLQLAERCAAEIERVGVEVARCLIRGGKVLTCGNGGSASDSEHIAAEFVGRYRRERRSVPAISLTGPGALITAIGNDYGYDKVFQRQVEGQGTKGDILFCLSTSGNSVSVLNAAHAARQMGIFTVGLTGESGGKLAAAVDVPILVPSKVTAHIQECHITIAHMVCEIADELLEQSDSDDSTHPVHNNKLQSLKNLVRLREKWRQNGQTVVWTNGCFDLLHIGHIRNLRDAKAEGSILIVGINSDRSVHEIKGPTRPIQSEAERAEMLASLDCVDYVTIFDDPTPVASLELIQPDVHCKGADYANGAKPVPEREIVERHGGRIHFLKLHPGFSTTSLIDRIRSEKA